MRKDKQVWVELNVIGLPVRILKSRNAALRAEGVVWQMTRAQAVGAIRRQIFIRSEGYCELCASPVLESSGHMHEQRHRGKGGEISLANSVFICPTCHKAAHADRNPRFTKKKP